MFFGFLIIKSEVVLGLIRSGSGGVMFVFVKCFCILLDVFECEC